MLKWHSSLGDEQLFTVVTSMVEHEPTVTVFFVWKPPKHASPMAKSAASRMNFIGRALL